MKGLEEEGLRPRGWRARLLRRKRAKEDTRVVSFPHAPHSLLHPHGRQPHYRGNSTSTTKYTPFTFLPKSLFEQYRRVANIYFTLNAALSLTPYSPVRPWTTFLPLVLVLGIAMIKEGIEDYKRYRQDVEVNHRAVDVLVPEQGGFVAKKWADVRVGDIIIVYKDEFFAADLLFLGAENEDGLCYIETMQLDGETNLKIKKALDETKHYNTQTLAELKATVRCEPPNSRLYHFTGNLELPQPGSSAPLVVPVPPAAVLLRGCSLRNTHKIFGLVLYAGHDTKIFMNSTQPPSKRSKVERTVDRIILFMFALLFAMCLVGCISFAWWTAAKSEKHWYLATWGVPSEYDPAHPVVVAVTNFITAFILYSYLIPISLYVSIEMVKIVQAFVFIGKDRDMYHADSDTPAELGMVNTVLTDKTGTLTRNVMEFFKASIGGVAYGTGITEIERANAERRGIELRIDGTSGARGESPVREAYFNFWDERVMAGAWAAQPNPQLAREFFRMLALCHTVIPDGPPDPASIRYEAESPDEAALVVAAKVFGFFFFKRTNTTLYLRESLPEGVTEAEYEVLNILEFNSTRKRMSVVLRAPDNRVLLYCKGADTVIYERMARGHPTNEALREVTLGHMEDFGSAGLRTLCLAFRELDPAFYDQWQERYIVAKTSLDDRQARVDEVSEEIERELVLLGCTAIEDKLQEGVPDCIKALADASIRLWVLTGDKMETAINIGYACSLITDEMTQFQVTGHTPEVEALEHQGLLEDAMLLAGQHVQSELERIATTLADDAAAGVAARYALVVDGRALLYALSPMLRRRFLDVSLRCAAVVCCRVSPLQKAQVTALVKGHGDVTLAIGDGANDVGMIQKAHIGVGISGQEGMQAVMAADFAIAQFRFLTPLLLVHGRLNYKRITRMIMFFFYKNLLFGITIFVYNAFALFSGQRVYNDIYMTLFNVVFTVSTPLVVGWFDRDLDKQYGTRYPLLYRDGQRNLYFSPRAITGWLLVAVLHAVIILGCVVGGAHPTNTDRADGHTLALEQNGIFMFSIVIVAVNLQLASVLDQWTWAHHASLWGSIALWFLFLLIYGAMPLDLSTDLYHLFAGSVGNSPLYWLLTLVSPIVCVTPVFAVRQAQRYFRPKYYQVVQEIAARERRGEAVFEEDRLVARGGARVSGGAAALTAAVARSGRYSGFVPPYEARSRVFDSNELRASAVVAGYTISRTGDVGTPPRASERTLSAAALALGLQRGASSVSAAPYGSVPPPPPAGPGSAASSGGTAEAAFEAAAAAAAGGAHPSVLAPAFGPHGLSRAGGSGRLPAHRRTASAGAVLHRPHHAPSNSGGSGGAAAPVPEGYQLARLSLGSVGGAPARTDAPYGLPLEEPSYAENPVLTRLEAEFSRDPRRHRHGAKLSFTSVTARLGGSADGGGAGGGGGGAAARTPRGSAQGLLVAPVATALGVLRKSASFTGMRQPGTGGGGSGSRGTAAPAELQLSEQQQQPAAAAAAQESQPRARRSFAARLLRRGGSGPAAASQSLSPTPPVTAGAGGAPVAGSEDPSALQRQPPALKPGPGGSGG
ncbi:phospholipid-transporting ATPase [Raphidocelis subcapitata]|uniref:Phospholipid-transporting ATPase n=1 Tax=Raphidocelis subcapitata TaxID=307507 RepID=A0A2V0NVC5_9CHLO|nr:phospholipid-transporting ATPase [Raphidocelis subcapitata]|eukprot:GBF89503.1 phospholipid-transporting ATPase [Raphidocelis subcapitata]